MEDREPTVRGRELGIELRKAMVAAGYDGKRLAGHLGWAQSRVSRLLSGKRTAREVDVAAFLAVCGVAGAPRERLLTLCRQESTPNPLELHGARLPKSFGRAADYESDAGQIVSFACVTIPVLLRAARYARALAVASPLVSPDSVDDAVAAMLRRSAGRIQAVEASASSSSVNTSLGFFQPWILRGRSLISAATAAR